MTPEQAVRTLQDSGYRGEIPERPSIAECDQICKTIGASYVYGSGAVGATIFDVAEIMEPVNEALMALNPEWDPSRPPGAGMVESIDRIAALLTEDPDVSGKGGVVVMNRGTVIPFDDLREGQTSGGHRWGGARWERGDPKPMFHVFVPAPDAYSTKYSSRKARSPWGYYSYTPLWPMGGAPAGQPGAYGGCHVQRTHKTLTMNRENVAHLVLSGIRVF
jgi:hypothetical protein